MSSRLRIGLIGCGSHSQENLIPSLVELWQIGEIDVVAACDNNPVVAKQAAAKLPGCALEYDFRAMIQHSDLDALVVAATPQVHTEVANLALRRGIHIFVEKPPTVNTDELVSLAELAEDKRLVTCVGHNLRHTAAAIAMKSMIETNSLLCGSGEISGALAAMEMRYLASKPTGDRWLLGSPFKSFLLSHANHAIDFMIYLMGSIGRVNAALSATCTEGVTLSAQFVFESGGVGNLLATSLAPHFSISGSVIGSDGRVVALDSLHEVTAFGIPGGQKRFGQKWIRPTLGAGLETSGYQTELAQFFQAIRADSPSLCQPSFGDEVAVYNALDQIMKIIEREIPVV